MPSITKRSVDAAKPKAKAYLLWDSDLAGFGVLVLPSGVKSFVLQYRNQARRSRRHTIGRYGVFSVDQARAIAREAAVAIAKGGDPVAAKQSYRAAPAMADLFQRYLQEYAAAHNAESTQKDVAAIVENQLNPRIGGVKVNDFTRADAARLHTAMKHTPRRANHTLAVLSKALTLAEVWGLRPQNSNPCYGLQRFPENHRTRFLGQDEVKRLQEALTEAVTIGLPWKITANGSKHLAAEENRRTILSWGPVTAIRLLLLTGARLSEITNLRWSDLDLVAGTIALPAKKGGKREPHPASNAALAVIAELPRVNGALYVFPRETDSTRPVSREVMQSTWQRLKWRAGIEDVHIHDLRHTVGTYAAQVGVSGFIVRDLLRHSNITTTGRYANFDANPVRAVANAVGARIAAALEPQLSGEGTTLPAGTKQKPRWGQLWQFTAAWPCAL